MRYILAILIVIINLDLAYAQNLDKDTIKLQEVEVKGVKPREKDKSLLPIQSLSRIELDYIPGNTVAEAINSFSGITLKNYGGIGGLKTVMVRSLGSNHTGVFIDGIQFSDAATGQIDLGKISIENASEVSLYIGQSNDLSQSARYYSSASIININSLVPDFSSKPLRTKAGFKYGSFGLIQPFATVNARISRKSHAGISLSYTNAHGEYPFLLTYGNLSDTIASRKNSDIKALNLDASYVYSFTNKQSLSCKIYYYNSERGLPGAIVFYNPFAKQRLWNKDLMSAIQYKNNFTDKFALFANIKFSQNYLRYLDPEYLNEAGELDSKYLQREYYGSVVGRYKLIDSLSFSLASDFFVNTLNANLYNYSNPIRYTSLTALATNFTNKRIEISGNVLGTIVMEKSFAGEPIPNRFKLSPTACFSYKILKNGQIRLRLLYKDIFRIPTFNDLYYTLVGNNELQPENAKQVNMGISAFTGFWMFKYLSLNANAFYNNVSDKIVAIPTKNLFIWSMQNIGVVDIRGFELHADIETNTFWSDFKIFQTAKYTFQRALDITKEGSPTYKNQIPYIPYETFSSRSTISFNNLSFSYNVLFNGFRYVLGENTYENMIHGWWINDITLIYDWNIKSMFNIRIKGEINNLFNKQYEVIRSFPMPGRSYFITIIFNY